MDGAAAIAAAASERPDIVMLDLGMPRLDGLEVIAGPSRLDDGPDPRGLRTHRRRRQGRGPGRGRRRLRHEAVPDGRTARPPARADTREPRPQRREPTRWCDSQMSRSISCPRTVTRDGASVRLTPTEWHVLEFLVRHPGLLVSRQDAAHRDLGQRAHHRHRAICASTSRSCARSSKPTRRDRATSSPSPGWATGSCWIPEARHPFLRAQSRGSCATLRPRSDSLGVSPTISALSASIAPNGAGEIDPVPRRCATPKSSIDSASNRR